VVTDDGAQHAARAEVRSGDPVGGPAFSRSRSDNAGDEARVLLQIVQRLLRAGKMDNNEKRNLRIARDKARLLCMLTDMSFIYFSVSDYRRRREELLNQIGTFNVYTQGQCYN